MGTDPNNKNNSKPVFHICNQPELIAMNIENNPFIANFYTISFKLSLAALMVISKSV